MIETNSGVGEGVDVGVCVGVTEGDGVDVGVFVEVGSRVFVRVWVFVGAREGVLVNPMFDVGVNNFESTAEVQAVKKPNTNKPKTIMVRFFLP